MDFLLSSSSSRLGKCKLRNRNNKINAIRVGKVEGNLSPSPPLDLDKVFGTRIKFSQFCVCVWVKENKTFPKRKFSTWKKCLKFRGNPFFLVSRKPYDEDVEFIKRFIRGNEILWKGFAPEWEVGNRVNGMKPFFLLNNRKKRKKFTL